MSPREYTVAVGGLLALAMALVLSPAPVVADDVVLENGNVFEGVIVVSEDADKVVLRIAHGEMSLPRSWIARIERAPSPLAEYLERRQALLTESPTDVEAWLELARWARPRELTHGYKEALLEAAQVDPEHRELAPLLRGIGYVREEATGIWVSAAEVRRAEAAAEAQRIAAERARQTAQRRPETQATDGEALSRAIETLAAAQVEREIRERERDRRSERTFYPLQVGTYRGPVFPVAFFPAAPVPATGEPPTTTAPVDPYDSLRRRQPGSLIVARPGNARVNSLSRTRRQPGALALGRPR